VSALPCLFLKSSFFAAPLGRVALPQAAAVCKHARQAAQSRGPARAADRENRHPRYLRWPSPLMMPSCLDVMFLLGLTMSESCAGIAYHNRGVEEEFLQRYDKCLKVRIGHFCTRTQHGFAFAVVRQGSAISAAAHWQQRGHHKGSTSDDCCFGLVSSIFPACRLSKSPTNPPRSSSASELAALPRLKQERAQRAVPQAQRAAAVAVASLAAPRCRPRLRCLLRAGPARLEQLERALRAAHRRECGLLPNADLVLAVADVSFLLCFCSVRGQPLRSQSGAAARSASMVMWSGQVGPGLAQFFQVGSAAT
jgi:hypothetical protein